MGFTLRAVLDAVGSDSVVEVAELVPAVVSWNEEFLGALANRPLEDTRVELHRLDVREKIVTSRERYAAILLDVDNGPRVHAHQTNRRLYSSRGLQEAWRALEPGGVLGVWSFGDDASFTRRLGAQGFVVQVHRVEGSRRGRGRRHVIWVARRGGNGRPSR